MSARGRGGRKRQHVEEEHENHERWLVTYADMLTLLMVLFIVLFAISQVDEKKFAALKEGMTSGFGAPNVAMVDTGTTIQDASNADSPMDLSVGAGPSTSISVEDEELQKAIAAQDRARQQQQQEEAQQEVDNLETVQALILDELTRQGLADAVRFSIDERGLIVTIITTSIIFEGNRAELRSGGQDVLNAIGPALLAVPNRIEVDGHTNQLNVSTANYPSGWELSGARASTVVRYLHSRFGIAENRMAAVAYGDTRPLYDPSDPRAETLNRRVEIIVLTSASAEISALLPSAVGSETTTEDSGG